MLPSSSSPLDKGASMEYCVKFLGESYRHVAWIPQELLRCASISLWREWNASHSPPCQAYGEGTEIPQRLVTPHVDWEWTVPDRVLEQRFNLHHECFEFLVKWRGLGYTSLTWELSPGPQDDDLCAEIERFQTHPSASVRCEPGGWGDGCCSYIWC